MTARAFRQSQHGWVGLVVILIALLIVAMLAQTALKSYGLLPGPDKASAADTTAAAPGAATGAPAAAPGTPIERARGLEQQVKRDAEAQEKRIDESTQ